MPSLPLPDLFLCADGGGTTVTVAIASATGGVLARGQAGPCNVKTVGVEQALRAILVATAQALAELQLADAVDTVACPPALRRRVFKGVWLGLAGIGPQADIDAFSSHAHAAFLIPVGQVDALRITNDGNLLAAPCALIPHVDSTVVLVAGTAFVKSGVQLQCVGVTRGWGYLLGDEGSAYAIGRLAIRAILHDDDARQTSLLSSSLSPSPTTPPKLLPIYTSILHHLGVTCCSALVDKTYSDHSSPDSPSFKNAEATRKVWVAELARVVFDYAFGERDVASREVALGIAREASTELVEMASRLVGDRALIEPKRSALALGGGLWKVKGYRDILVERLRDEKGIKFAEVVLEGDAAEAGVLALVAQA
ncbi:glucokinase regulator family protein [Pseudohyphozyma bogoriensis]|nr:glucokinase regulator family protein [Pseudohyphozyma bogoriensis]